MLMGARPVPPTLSLRGPGGVFWGSKIKVITGCVFGLPPAVRKVLSMFLLGQYHKKQLGLRFLSRVLSLICVVSRREIGRPNRPYDAHDAGSWGAAGRLKCAINPNKPLKMQAVGSVCGCKYQ